MILLTGIFAKLDFFRVYRLGRWSCCRRARARTIAARTSLRSDHVGRQSPAAVLPSDAAFTRYGLDEDRLKGDTFGDSGR